MNRFSVYSVMLAVAFGAMEARAQDEYFYYAPQKDVAMLVDVSGSVGKDNAGHEGTLQIIQDLLSGRPFSESGWTVDPGPDPEMKDLFANYLRMPSAKRSAELRPLIAPGNSLLTLPMGKFAKVLSGDSQMIVHDVQAVGSLLEAVYPKKAERNDTSTCYWYAMARAASILSQRSKRGYYLFVASDLEDDPDYRKDGPPAHSDSDYKSYLAGIAKFHPESAIRDEIGKFFEPTGMNKRNAEMYRPRGDFKQVLIAKFSRPGIGDANKVSLYWYAMGVEPVEVRVPRQPPPVAAVAAVPGAPPAPLEYKGPSLTPRLQLLGNLSAGRKRYNYERPVIVWQINNLESGGWDVGSKTEVKLANSSRGAGGPVKESPRQTVKSWQLSGELQNGSHSLDLEIEETQNGSQNLNLEIEDRGKRTEAGTGPRILTKEIEIEKRSYSDLWLTILAIGSTVAAIVIFIFAWRSLRPMRVASPA